MEDEVDRLRDLEMLREVVMEKREAVAAKVLDILERACLEVVDADDTMSLRDEPVGEVRPQEACASSDEGGRHPARC
ncbi:MAG: hypothetical protein QOF75_1759 [Gaiellaceae bacterium]|nr:hypothetical protein [Gaiellaceae bacterium]